MNLNAWLDAAYLLAAITLASVFGEVIWKLATAHIPNFPGIKEINGLL